MFERPSATSTAKLVQAVSACTGVLKGWESLTTLAILILFFGTAVPGAHAAATATTNTLTVGLTTAPTTAITTTTYGTSVTLTAAIAPTTAAGTVTFMDGSTALGSAVTVASGKATLATTALPAATDSLTAVFTPTTPASFAASTSSAKSLLVTQATATVTLAVGLTSAPATAITTATYGASVTMTATITPASAAGTVTFKDGTSTVGSPVTVSSGTAALATTTLTLGANSLTAVFTPTTPADYTSPTSAAKTVTVSPATTTTALAAALTSAPGTPVATAPSGTSVTLSATVSPAIAGTVTFMSGSTTLGSSAASAGVATLATSSLASGTDLLTATFAPTNSADYSGSTSSALSFVVTKPAGSTTLTVTGPYYYDSPVTMAASVSPSAATGTVTFKNGSTTLGTCTLSSGGCSASVSTLPLGASTLTAVYGGDSSYATSTSSGSTITILATPTQVALTSSTSQTPANTAFTLTARVTAQAGTATVSAGSVTFYDSSTSLGKASVNSSGVATLVVSAGLAAQGNHYLLASYGGVYSNSLAEFSTSLSASTKVSVVSSQTISFPAPVSPAVYGTTASLAAASTSGLTVTFSTTSSAVCSVSGTTLSYIGVGSCTVTANQAGNGSYTAAAAVSHSVTVSPAAPTINHWYNTSTVYGTPVTLSASATGGGAITYSVVSGPGRISGGSTLTPNAAGTIVVGATVAASADYSAVTTPVTRTVTVYQAPLLITASSPTVTFGAAVPTITPIYATLVNGDISSSLSTQPTCHTVYTNSSAPGSYNAYCYGAVDANYSITYGNGSVTVNKATPTISVEPSPSQITYGAALSTSTLTGGTASVAGSFAWTSGSTIPRVGSSQSVTFTPSNGTDYSTATGSVTANVAQATPTISVAPTASSVQYGSALSASKLSGGSAIKSGVSVAGTFAWTSGSTTMSTIGANSEGVTFSPADSTDYSTATGNASVTVTKATAPVTTWPTASSIAYGSPLSASTLSGGVGGVSGTFAWTTPTVVATTGTHAESVTFTPSNTTDYANATATVQITVSRLQATVSVWPSASSITYGQTLSSSWLSGGSASVPGTFAWTAPSTAPNAGTQAESVTFTPSNSTLYTTVSGSVNVTVNQLTPSVDTWPTASSSFTPGTVASSTLNGGSASFNSNPLGGNFAWTSNSTPLIAGNNSYSVTFTPTDAVDYTSVTGTVNITVNPCGFEDNTNASYPAAQYLFSDGSTPTLPSPLSIDVEGANGSAVCAVNSGPGDSNADATVTYPFITSNSISTYGSDSSTWGTNAAVLAYGTVPTTGTGATITIADDGAGDPGSIITSNDNSSGVFASMGGTVNITDAVIATSGNYSRALEATNGGTLVINNVQAFTTGNNSSVVLAGVGGGTVTVTGGVYNSSGAQAAGIRAAGAGSAVAVSDGPAGISVATQNASAVEVEGGNSVSIQQNGGGTSISGAAGNDHGVLLWEGNSGDAVAGTSSFTMTGGSLGYVCDATQTASCASGQAASNQNNPATLFAVANTTATITLTDVIVTNDTPTSTDSNGTLLTAAVLNGGTPGANGGNVAFAAYGETLTGDVIVDSLSAVSLTLNADSASSPVPSVLTGAINNANSGATTVSLTLDSSSSWIVTGDSYLTSLTNPVSGNANITCANGVSCTVYVGGNAITIGSN